jgi:hypothetical protein
VDREEDLDYHYSKQQREFQFPSIISKEKWEGIIVKIANSTMVNRKVIHVNQRHDLLYSWILQGNPKKIPIEVFWKINAVVARNWRDFNNQRTRSGFICFEEKYRKKSLHIVYETDTYIFELDSAKNDPKTSEFFGLSRRTPRYFRKNS